MNDAERTLKKVNKVLVVAKGKGNIEDTFDEAIKILHLSLITLLHDRVQHENETIQLVMIEVARHMLNELFDRMFPEPEKESQ